jgi:peptide/nickel transport system substrate-binding protein
MAGTYSRRQFLSTGARAAAGVALVGTAGGLLDACGGTAGSGASAAGQVSGRTTAVPRRGGTLRAGLEADFNSFSPTTGQFDTSGIIYASTVFDALTTIDASGKVQPYLAQSITPNPDYTVWTLTVRPNVEFHDGTPLTSAEVTNALQAVQSAALTGPGLTDMDTVKATGPMTVVITTKRPWIAFPYYLAGQPGYVPSPKTLSSAAGGMHPIGTGPFIFEEWVPGSHFYANRNPKYWRQGLPYVDRVEYNTIPDSLSRQNSLLAGTIDIMHSSDSTNLHSLGPNNSIQYLTDQNNNLGEPSMDMTMLNTAVPPTNDLRVRQALAYAVPQEQFQQTYNFGLYKPATGLFQAGSVYGAANNYPQYDLAKAKQLVQQYEAQNGKISLQLGTTNTQRTAQVIQLVQQYWQAAGITTTLKQVEQVQLITNALEGQYQAVTWRQFQAYDPDTNYVWWSIPTAAPVGQSALNFARNKDPQVQSALDTGRTNPDPAARVDAYRTINQRFGDDLPYLFSNKTVWGCYAAKNVQNFNGRNLPSGAPAVFFSFGIFYPESSWLSA